MLTQVRKVEKKREIINRLNKTKAEAYPDLAKERSDRDAEVIRLRKQRAKKEAEKQAALKKQMKEEAEKRDYQKHLLKEEWMVSNEDMTSSKDTSAAVDYEEDFM